MLRKIGLHHRGSTSSIDPADEDHLATERPQHTHRAQSEASRGLLDAPNTQQQLPNHRRNVSSASSSFPGDGSGASQEWPSTELYGLHPVYDNGDSSGDIIFVHGLGGSAIKTWSWNQNTDNFWPSWLADNDSVPNYRVFTFGYNSNFKGTGTNLNITDFAKDLLFRMLTFSKEGCEPIGGRPILFVAHSMGGLVVKKACILGKYDREFSEIVSRVHGIIFLATPHRGATYAKILNNILSTAPTGAPPKAYVADLDTRSGAIQDINEQFRTVCEGLALVSFFETLKIGFGLTKILVVEKESGILGYPQETSNPLNADHHTICKFRSREDGNYITVKNALKLLASRISPAGVSSEPPSRLSDHVDLIKDLEPILGVRDRAEDDFNVHRNRILDGTCHWLTQKRELRAWIEGTHSPQQTNMFWLIGLPATGKSTLSTAVIDQLRFLGKSCQFHYFSAGHQMKRTAAFCLRSIVFQLAISNEEFRGRLFTLHEESGISFNSRNQVFKVIWEKIFEGIISQMRFSQPLYWVLDAIDESDQYVMLISHLARLQSTTPIKLFFSSRPIKIPVLSAASAAPPMTCFLSEKDTASDVQTYVRRTVRDILPDKDHTQQEVTNQILAKASGSFLWVKLALETLSKNWHTQDDILRALTDIPKGMENLYAQMLATIQAQSPRLQLMAKRILIWAACSWRPLSILELEIALQPEFAGFVKLEETIVEICGHFVAVDNAKVSIIHATARSFLLSRHGDNPDFINSQEAHEHIATICLRYLSSDDWRKVLKNVRSSSGLGTETKRNNRLLVAEKRHPFLGYATCYWAYHLSKSSTDSEALLTTLNEFLNDFCLSWIEAIALTNNLRYLTTSAQYLKAYVKRMNRSTRSISTEFPLGLKHYPEDNSKVIKSWAIDFVRIVGRFGMNLIQNPSTIYRLIPQFCPRGSMIGETFGLARIESISVSGLPQNGWNDCLASVSVGEYQTASRVLATESFFITLVSGNGEIVLWYADTCEKARTLDHNEYVLLVTLDKSQSRLASAGTQSYRVWDLSSGKELYRIPKVTQALTLALGFGIQNSDLLVGLDNCSVTCYDLDSMAQRWTFRPQHPHDIVQQCPRLVSFSPDVRRVAMAWRGKPPMVWNLATASQAPDQCRIRSTSDAICSPEAMTWQSDGTTLLVLCHSTTVVEWRIDEEEQIEYGHVEAREIALSQDGSFLLTADHAGTISIWTFPRLSLIYRLVNENEFIRGLSFSPDNQRFYDVRGSSCNVWEPDALIRVEDNDMEDHSSIGDLSLATEPIVRNDESSQCSITALAPGLADQYFCIGRENGTVAIHEAFEGRRVRKAYSHSASSSVIALSWAASGKFIVSGDDSGRIITKRLEAREAGKWAVFPVLDFRLEEPAQQFLFSSDEKALLVSTPSIDQVWNLKTKKQICGQRWGYRQSRKWIPHPFRTDLLVWIDPREVHTYSWAALQHTDPVDVPPKDPSTPSRSPCIPRTFVTDITSNKTVQWIALTQNKKYIVYETFPAIGHTNAQSPGGLHLELLSTSDLQVQHAHSLASDCIEDLAGEVKRLIGTWQDRIVFLDHSNWLCTWEIDSPITEIKRHFFLPRDWLNPTTLQMATLNAHGTLFCPKHGDVAIVRNGLRL